MDEEKLLYFKGLLEATLRDLLIEAGRTCSDMRQGQNGDFPDPTDRASLEADRNLLLRIRDRERKLIQKVEEALDRIDKGIFGICESCGKSISEKRLMARPVTTLCIDCKTDRENQERVERQRGTRQRSNFPS